MKLNLKLSFLVLLFALATIGADAQPPKNFPAKQVSREELSKIQATHIANEIALDEATAARFIEVYCQFQDEIWTTAQKNKEQRPQIAKEEMTDEQIGQMLRMRFDHSQKLLDIRKKYYQNYSQFLTQRQIERIYSIEKQMMKRISKPKGEAPAGGPKRDGGKR